MLCVLILYISGGTYSLKLTPNDRFFEKLFMTIFGIDLKLGPTVFNKTFHGSFNLLSEFLPEICWEEIAEEILFVFCFNLWSVGPSLKSIKNDRFFWQTFQGSFNLLLEVLPEIWSEEIAEEILGLESWLYD